MLAIIGGSGLTQLANLDISHREVIRTPYGDPSGAVTFGEICDRPVVFLARHGYGHAIPPHEVNYRANIWALHSQGAVAMISVASVGGIRPDLKPGDLVIPDQIIDYTWGRKSTFHDGLDGNVVHVDFTEPYDRVLRERLLRAAKGADIFVHPKATYAATQGPRLETAAEINRLEKDGADVVGMTGMPEAVLAREMNMPYAAINVVANHAAGRGDSRDGIQFESMSSVLHQTMVRARLLIEMFVECD